MRILPEGGLRSPRVELLGVEFVYPKERAVVLAEKSKEPVFAAAQAAPDATSEVVVVTPEKKEIKLEEYRPATAPPARVVQSVPETQVAENVPSHLPKTGSDLPLVGLVGIAALGSAAAMRLARQHA